MIVKVIDIIENADGSATINLDYSKEFPKMVRKYYGKKRCSTKMMEKFLIEGLQNYIEKEKK